MVRELFVSGLKETDDNGSVFSRCLSNGKPGKAANVGFYGMNKVLCFIIGLALATPTVADDFMLRPEWSA